MSSIISSVSIPRSGFHLTFCLWLKISTPIFLERLGVLLGIFNSGFSFFQELEIQNSRMHFKESLTIQQQFGIINHSVNFKSTVLILIFVDKVSFLWSKIVSWVMLCNNWRSYRTIFSQSKISNPLLFWSLSSLIK